MDDSSEYSNSNFNLNSLIDSVFNKCNDEIEQHNLIKSSNKIIENDVIEHVAIKLKSKVAHRNYYDQLFDNLISNAKETYARDETSDKMIEDLHSSLKTKFQSLTARKPTEELINIELEPEKYIEYCIRNEMAPDSDNLSSNFFKICDKFEKEEIDNEEGLIKSAQYNNDNYRAFLDTASENSRLLKQNNVLNLKISEFVDAFNKMKVSWNEYFEYINKSYNKRLDDKDVIIGDLNTTIDNLSKELKYFKDADFYSLNLKLQETIDELANENTDLNIKNDEQYNTIMILENKINEYEILKEDLEIEQARILESEKVYIRKDMEFKKKEKEHEMIKNKCIKLESKLLDIEGRMSRYELLLRSLNIEEYDVDLMESLISEIKYDMYPTLEEDEVEFNDGQSRLLLDACFKANFKQIYEIITDVKKCDINYYGYGYKYVTYKTSPLILLSQYAPMLAILVLKLYKKEINVNQKNHYGNSALHYACYKGYHALVRELVSFDYIDLDSIGIKGRTPLHYAAARSFNKCIRYLKNAGCNMYLDDINKISTLDIGNHIKTWGLEEFEDTKKLLLK